MRPLGRSTFTPPKSSFDSPLYGLVSLRRSHNPKNGLSRTTVGGVERPAEALAPLARVDSDLPPLFRLPQPFAKPLVRNAG